MSQKNAKASKKGLRTSVVSTVIGISLVLFLIGLVGAGMFFFQTIEQKAKESVQADLFFGSKYNAADIKQVEQELKGWDCFSEVTYVSPERALEEFQGSDQESNELLAIYEGEDILPPTISFRPEASYSNKAGMNKIKQRILKAFPEMVTEVNYDAATLSEVNLGFKQIVFVILALAALLIVIAIAMINNTIRLSLYSKRFNIKTMQLVGATSGFIRRPFVRQSLMQGLLAGVIAMALLMLVFFGVNNILYIIQIDLTYVELGLLFAGLLVFGALLTLVSTWFALNKYLRMKLDDLY